MEKKPIKTKAKKKQPVVAEVVRLREPDLDLVSILQRMLKQAETGELTSIVACITVNGEDEVVLMGRPDQPAKAIGNLEIIKAELTDCVRSLYTDNEM